MTTPTIERDSDLAKAFRLSRGFGAPSYALQGWAAPEYRGQLYSSPHDGKGAAAYALAKAREALARVDAARAAYEAAEGEGAGLDSSGAFRATSDAAVKARRAYVDAKGAAGLFHSADSFRPSGGYWAPDRTSYSPGASSPFRSVRPCHYCEGGPRHTGWYDNPHGESARDGSGLIWGVVAQLSGKDGRPRFLAGWQQGGTDGGPVFAMGRGFFDDESDAAAYADGLAERVAEDEKEYQESWGAGARWADLGETIATARAEALELARERRAALRAGLQSPAACRTIRHRIATLWDSICEARRDREELARGVRRDNAEAFAEGAGLTAAEALALA